MKKLFITTLSALFVLLYNSFAFGQASSTNHLGILGQWLGWDGFTTIDLDIRHDGQQNINFSTAGTQRMTLRGNNNIGFAGSSNLGYFGLLGDEPHARLHLGKNLDGTHNGWRPWMGEGVLVSTGHSAFYGSGDVAYFGLKQNEDVTSNNTNRSDAVVVWGDDIDPTGGPDMLRFLFVNGSPDVNDPSYPMDDVLEVARFMPEGKVGIGNFSSSNGGIYPDDPDNTLDVNGHANIREVDNDDALTQVMVRDPNANGLIKWRDVASLVDARSGASKVGNFVEWGGGGGGLNPLLQNTEVAMRDATNLIDWSIYFTGQSAMTNNFNTASIGIGQPWLSTLNGKLDLSNFTTTGTGYDFINRDGGLFHTHGNYTGPPVGYIFTGVHGICEVQTQVTRTTNVGGDFYASRNDHLNIGARGSALIVNATNESLTWSENIGVRGVALQTNCALVGRSYGVSGEGTGGEFAYGVRGIGMRGGRMSIGVYGGLGTTSIDNICPGTALTSWAVYAAGPLLSGGLWQPSDEMLKQNIEPLAPEAALEIISALTPTTYDYDTETYSSMGLPTGLQYGLLAQQVEEVLPSSVRGAIQPAEFDTLGTLVKEEVEYKAVNYVSMIPILIAAVKDLKQQNEDIAAQLQTLQECCSQGGAFGPQGSNQRVDLGDYAIILDQNSPNPFAEQTTITFIIPADVKDAKIIFYDNNGRVLKSVQVTERGPGSLLVYASNLSSGTYTYSLIADGKLIDTKKMVCQK